MPDTAEEIELSEQEMAAWAGFLVTHRRVISELDCELEREHGLPLVSYEVLLYLANAPDHALRMGELADRLLLSRSGLTRLVDRLAARGLVERHSCDLDRRGTYARLTDAGLALFREARPTHLRGVREHFLDHIPERDLRRLGAIWQRIEPE